jgi:hypothetical protein
MSRVNIKFNIFETFYSFWEDLRRGEDSFFLENFKIPNILKENSYRLSPKVGGVRNIQDVIFLFIIKLTFIYNLLLEFKNIQKIKKLLLNNLNIIEKIYDIIPTYTNQKWGMENVDVYIVLKNWAEMKKEKIYIGIKPSKGLEKENVLISLLIHELIHFNTHNLCEKIMYETKANEDIFMLAEELAVILLTRRIQKERLNASYEDLQKLSVELQDIKDEDLEKLEKDAQKLSFNQLIVGCYLFLGKNKQSI